MERTSGWLSMTFVLALALAACSPSDTAGEETTTSVADRDQPTTSQATDDGDDNGEDSDEEPGAEGGRLVVAQGVDPRTFTPWTSVAAELSVTTQIFEKLIAFNLETGDYDPILAESYEWVDDITLQIPLKEGVTFSNGEALDADAALFNLGLLLDPDIGGIELSNRTANIDSVEKIDDMTVQINFVAPIARSLNLANLAQSTFMVPPGYFGEVGYEGFIEDPIGSGPMILSERVRDSFILLSRNESYAGNSGPAPTVDEIEFKILPEPGARVAALEGGDADLVVDLPFEEAERLTGMDDLEVVSIPGLRVMEIQVDMRHGLSDASASTEVRQALLYALDRQLIIDTVFLGQGQPVDQLGVGQYFGFVESLPALEYDPDRVQDLLTDAGYPDGVNLPLKCPSGRYLKDREVCEVIVSELAKVGIDATPFEALEVGAYFEGVLAGEIGPMIYIGRLAPSINMVDMYNSSLCESSDSYKCDEQLDALHTASRTEPDPEAQKAAIEEMVRYDLEDPNRIPLWVLNDVYALSGDVQVWAPRSDQVLEFWGVGVSG